MNLLLLTAALECGGAETHVVTLARALKQRGHTVTVASSGGSLADGLEKEGIAHHTVPLHSCLHLLSARRELKRLLRQQDFTLIHTHSRIAAFAVFPLARKKRIPLVTTVHAQFRVTPLFRRLSRWGTHTIAVSEDLKQYLCAGYGISPDCVTVIPNGIEAPPTVPTPSADKPRLIFCSRLDPDCSEGAFALCAIAPRLRKSIPDLEILLIGGGAMYSTLQRSAEEINHAMGALAIRCVGAHPSPMDLFPTAQGVVGVSRVALEAMATGTPVILAGNEGFLGLAEEAILPRAEATNLCCRGEAPLTEDKLYNACHRLLTMSTTERARRGKALSEYVQARHSMAHVAAATEAVYRQALEENPTETGDFLLLCGYYGYGNTGDDALLAAALRRAKQVAPTLSPTVLTKHGKKDESRVGARCLRRLSLQAYRALRQAKILIFGGGTLLQDVTSLRSLCYYATLIRLAKRHGARVELWANGIHPPTTQLGKHILQSALHRCDYIGLRDRASIHLAKELLGENATLIFEQDLAYPTPPASPQRIEFLLRHYTLNDRFAIIAPKGGSGTGLLKLLIPWLCALRAEGVQLVFVPLYPQEDMPLCRQLAVHKNDRILSHLSPSDLTGLMAHSDVVCGMRLHALIFAASAHTPFVGFGLDPKIEAFCREHGGVYFTDL